MLCARDWLMTEHRKTDRRGRAARGRGGALSQRRAPPAAVLALAAFFLSHKKNKTTSGTSSYLILPHFLPQP
jgi:hypothetical protein